MPAMIEALLNKITSLHYFLFSSKTLLPYEQVCLDAWRSSLSQNTKHILDIQLAAIQLIQHQAGGAKVCFYYKEEESIPLFGNEQPDLHAATIVLRTTGSTNVKQTMRVKVFVHEGRFFSIEFPKRPARYMQQHGIRPDALQVAVVENHMFLN